MNVWNHIPLDAFWNADGLFTRAAPTCHECREPVQRVEMRWHQEDGEWRLGPCFMVCAGGCRVLVEA